jgi:hypothetical protein
MMMLDWTNRTYKIGENKEVQITQQEVRAALRTDQLEFSEKETYIRDCFDALLDGMQKLEHLISIKLIEENDVEFPMRYSIEELTGLRTEIERYVAEYHFDKAKHFLNRFVIWRDGADHSRPACVQKPPETGAREDLKRGSDSDRTPQL